MASETTAMSYPSPWKSERVPSVVVVGDIMLDEYLEGNVSRISPEAPVPVHLVKGRSHRAGGAANVALSLAALGAKTRLIGVWGEDESREILTKILADGQVDTEYVYSDPTRPTTRKTRVTASRHQMLRLDWEESQSLKPVEEKKLLASLDSLKHVDVIVLSDYGKGLLSPEFLAQVQKLAEQKAWLSVVDPKGNDYFRYQGFDLITPNRKEALDALSLSHSSTQSPESLAQSLQEKYKLRNILITLGAEGMIFYPGHEEKRDQMRSDSFRISAHPVEVFDVSGAGDTVVAVMALALGASLSVQDAASLANLAAGKVVEKWGTYALSKDELLRAMKQQVSPSYQISTTKILGTKQFASLRDSLWKGKKIVFTNGCFDILHAGHVDYLEKARAKGDLLVVGLNSDDSVRRLKGPERPLNEFAHRARVLAGLGCVDCVIEFSEDTPLSLINSVKPNVLIKGSDYSVDTIVGAKQVLENGGEVATVELTPGLSTTNLAQKIKNL